LFERGKALILLDLESAVLAKSSVQKRKLRRRNPPGLFAFLY
jgi:hypothetical protein